MKTFQPKLITSLKSYNRTKLANDIVAGIAVTILVGQLKDFLGLSYAAGTPNIETLDKLKAVFSSFGTLNPASLLVGGIGLAILILWPMLGKTKLGAFSKICSKIPPSIIAVIVGICLVQLTSLDVNTIGSLYPNLSSGFPKPSLPTFEFETVKAVLPSAFTIAVLAAIESLLSCVVSDGMIGDRHNSNTELIAQGVGNICSGVFGGIPATGAIARTAANVKNGGRSPIAGIVHAVVLLLFLLVLMPLAKMIPMPIIAAILFMVAYNMSEWRRFVKICKSAPKSDILVLVVTFGLTVAFDLVVAIAVGLVLTAVLFIKNISDATEVRRWVVTFDSDSRQKSIPEGAEVYQINGPMFFADADKFAVFKMDEGTHTVVIRMSNVPSLDATAMNRFEQLYAVCRERNIRLIFSHVNRQPMSVMKRSGFYASLGAQAFAENIDEALKLAAQASSAAE